MTADPEDTGAGQAALDFERMAAGYDAVLPFLAPVALALLEHLEDLLHSSPALVVDLGCGTGEPGLTLARRRPDLRLLGLDSTPTMIEIARAKAALEPVSNAEFAVGRTEDTGIGDASVGAVLSRFCLLSYGDPVRSARELARILRRDGSFSLAVWHDHNLNTLPYTALTAVRDLLPAEALPPLDRSDPLNEPGYREALLDEAGLASVGTEEFRWTYDFADIESLWRLLTGPAMGAGAFELLDSAQADEARARLVRLLADYRRPDGSYRIPEACRLYWGRKP